MSRSVQKEDTQLISEDEEEQDRHISEAAEFSPEYHDDLVLLIQTSEQKPALVFVH